MTIPPFRLHLPLAGPVQGWVRRAAGGGVLVRFFAQPDDSESDLATAILLTYQVDKKRWYATADARTVKLDKAGVEHPFRFFVEDVLIPDAHFPSNGDPLGIEVFSLHLLLGGESYNRNQIIEVANKIAQREWTLSTRSDAKGLTEQNHAAPISPKDSIFDLHESDSAKLFSDMKGDLQKRVDQGVVLLHHPDPPTHSLERRRRQSVECALMHVLKPATANAGVTIFAGTCRYPGLGLDRVRIDRALPKGNETAHAMLLLGDQIYADATAGIFDTASMMEKYESRYLDWLSASGFATMARRLPIYATPDDHEFQEAWSSIDEKLDPVQAETARTLLAVYQMSHSPWLPHLPAGGISGAPPFDYAFEIGPARIYALDTVSFRDWRATSMGAGKPHPRLVMDRQLTDLEAWFKACVAQCAKRPIIIMTGAVVGPGFAANVESGAAAPDRAADGDTWQSFPEDRLRLLGIIAMSGAENVVLLSGDFHCAAAAEVWTLTNGEQPRKIATCVVAPPLYAPMRYVNALARELAVSEDIGGKYRISLRPDAPQPTDGSGYAILSVPPNGPVGVRWEVVSVADVEV